MSKTKPDSRGEQAGVQAGVQDEVVPEVAKSAQNSKLKQAKIESLGPPCPMCGDSGVWMGVSCPCRIKGY